MPYGSQGTDVNLSNALLTTTTTVVLGQQFLSEPTTCSWYRLSKNVIFIVFLSTHSCDVHACFSLYRRTVVRCTITTAQLTYRGTELARRTSSPTGMYLRSSCRTIPRLVIHPYIFSHFRLICFGRCYRPPGSK